MVEKQYYVYFITNRYNRTIYIGVTNNLKRRAYQHREKLVEGFTKRYNVTKLVHYEVYRRPQDAIQREKNLKGSSRKRKVDLIQSANPTWKDLYEEI